MLDVAGQTVRKLTTLSGVPYPHGPDDHAVFSVATDDYPAKPLADAVAGPLSGGVLDRLAGRLLARGMAADERAAAALVTPTHPPAADFEAAARLLEALGRLYDLPVEAATLRERSARIQKHYQELADRMAEAGGEETDPFVDRMYM